jgi:hypothetical protein
MTRQCPSISLYGKAFPLALGNHCLWHSGWLASIRFLHSLFRRLVGIAVLVCTSRPTGLLSCIFAFAFTGTIPFQTASISAQGLMQRYWVRKQLKLSLLDYPVMKGKLPPGIGLDSPTDPLVLFKPPFKATYSKS